MRWEYDVSKGKGKAIPL